uniref:Uncharacterized protein n=1 Tax=Anguilla anguilla TaxID=7936 RepID=A0A0E9XSE8_ANGAN
MLQHLLFFIISILSLWISKRRNVAKCPPRCAPFSWPLSCLPCGKETLLSPAIRASH